jgi:membrane protein implicated in regulation of membrane protease activity
VQTMTIVFEAAFGVLAICWVVLIFLWFRWSRWERRRRRRARQARIQQRAGYRIVGGAGTP